MGSISRRNTASWGCEVSLPTGRTAWCEKLERSAPTALTSSSVGSVTPCGTFPLPGNAGVGFGGVTRFGCAGASVTPSNANANNAARGCLVGGLGFMGYGRLIRFCETRDSADKETLLTGSTFPIPSVDAHGERTVHSELKRLRDDVITEAADLPEHGHDRVGPAGDSRGVGVRFHEPRRWRWTSASALSPPPAPPTGRETAASAARSARRVRGC